MQKNPNLDILLAVGPVVFGDRWQNSMTEVLGVHRKTITRWKQGEFMMYDTLPDGRVLYDVLKKLLDEHEKELLRAKRVMDRYAKTHLSKVDNAA